jgi:hypothetical protein
MTDAPEKIWFTKVGKNIIPNSQRMSPEDVEYLRKDKHIAYLADYRAAYEGSCEQIDELRAEVARLRAALNLIALQQTSKEWECEGDTEYAYNTIISKARAALAHGKTWQ